jgi:Flp pilus assembly protein TadG
MALTVPILMILLLGVADIGWYAVMSHRMAQVASTVTALTAREETISQAKLQDIFSAAAAVAQPFELATQGRSIVSSLTNPGGKGAKIAWQRLSPTGITAASRLGVAGSTPKLPTGFSVGADENIVVAECFFRFDPLVGFLIRGQQSVYVRAFERPRLATLDTIAP